MRRMRGAADRTAGWAARSALAGALSALLLAGCGGPDAELEPPAAVELLDVPAPDLARSESDVREQIEQARARLDGLRGAPETPAAELGRAYGRLGMLYHVYDLDEAAEACYRNARRLDPSEVAWTYYLGLLLQRRGELEASAAELEAVLAERPEESPALLRLGDVRLRLGGVEEALEAYRRAVELAPESAAARYGLGRAAARAGQTELAVAELERALELQPSATRIHYQLATVLRELGELERAEYHLGLQGPVEVSYVDPRQQELLLLARSAANRLHLAARLTTEGRLREAAEQYRAVLRDDPASLEARRGLAAVLALLGSTGEAERIYRELLAELPEDPVVHRRLGRVLESRGELEEAIAGYRAALRLAPELPGLHHDLARALHLDGRSGEALREYDAAIDESPQDRTLRYERAVVLASAGRVGDAVAAFGRLVEEDPADLDTRLLVARALAGLGRFEEMSGHCRAVLEAPSATPRQRARAAHNLATWRLQRGEAAEAERLFRDAAGADPSLREAQMGWGRALTALGRHREAAERFAAAARLAPDDPVARMAEAEALVAAGLERAARTRLEEALRARPGDPRLTHRLARLLATASDDAVREGRLALGLAQELLEESRSAVHAETVAMALAELGEFEEAVRLQRTLVEQAEVEADSRYVARLRENLDRYERGEPSRAP